MRNTLGVKGKVTGRRLRSSPVHPEFVALLACVAVAMVFVARSGWD